MNDPRVQTTGDIVVGVPDRDTLVVLGDADPASILEASASVLRLYKSESHPISELLFIKSGDKFETVDDGAPMQSHPIPDIDALDVYAVRKGGGATLSLVIASPLLADTRSIFRLHRKLDGYLQFIESANFESECGKPSPENTTVKVTVHKESDANVLSLIQSLHGWVESRGASLEVELIG
jgi:hypothetical protein